VVQGWTLGDGIDTDYVRLVDNMGIPRDTVLYGSPNVDGWHDDTCAGVGVGAIAPAEGEALAREVDAQDHNSAEEWIVQAPTQRASGGPPLLTVTPAPLQWGQQATFLMHGLRPGDEVVFLRSLQGASAPRTLCPAALGTCIDVALTSPQVMRRTVADADGRARIQLNMPSNSGTRDVWFQGVGAREYGGRCGWSSPVAEIAVGP
jgi:hypothetical protein